MVQLKATLLLLLTTLPKITSTTLDDNVVKFTPKGTQINIHIPLLPIPQNKVIEYNKELTNSLITPTAQQIDFVEKYVPHNTLYLSTFTNHSLISGEFQASANLAVLATMNNDLCKTGIENLQIGETLNQSGAYAMLSVTNTQCLQLLSNNLVLNLNQYLDPYAKNYIPSWVYNLPEEEQAIKIKYIKEYGSPNVFEGFVPHVTLAYDSANSTISIENYKIGCEELELKFGVIESECTSLGFGKVGDFGTVIRGVDGVIPNIGLVVEDDREKDIK